VRERGDEPERLAGSPLADRDLLPRVPPVDLGDLPGQVARALEGAGGKERRAHLGEVLLQDRDPAAVASSAQVLQDHGRRHLRVQVQHRRDLVGEGVHERRASPSFVAWWLTEGEQAVHGRVAHPKAPGDHPLGNAFAVQTVNLSPVLHSEHLFLLGSPDRPEHRPEPGLRSGRASRFQPARDVQYSGGVDKRKERLQGDGLGDAVGPVSIGGVLLTVG
jgi:hypothetical protein